MSKKWIFCDFDNTLMGTEALAIPSLVARINTLYASQSRTLTMEAFFEHFHGQSGDFFCRNLSDYLGISVDPVLIFANREMQVEQHFQREKVPVAPNLLATLQQFAAQKMRFAVVSNNMATRCLTALRFADDGTGEELARIFGTHFYSATAAKKPDPSCYLHAIAQTGANVAQACAVEDSTTGAIAATAAGLKTFGFLGFADDKVRHEQELLAVGVTQCFHDWKDFPGLLEKCA